MFAARFAMISNIVHRHPVATMHREDMLSLLECAQFCMEFVESVESHELHGPTKCRKGK